MLVFSNLFSPKKSFEFLCSPYLNEEIKSDLHFVADQLNRSFVSITEQCNKTTQVMQYILKKEYLKLSELQNNPQRFFAILDSFSLVGGASLGTALGVQLLLAGGGCLKLMAKKHYLPLINKIQNGDLLGCFAMTERDHGTNVPGIQTVAIYDVPSQQFIIDNMHQVCDETGALIPEHLDLLCQGNSKYFPPKLPNIHGSTKRFIGNAANAHFSIVFAQLIIKNSQGDYETKGPHPFFVPLQECSHPVPDQKFTTPQHNEFRFQPNSIFKFKNLGEKYGLNGIANYEIDMHTRVPLSHLMMHRLVTVSAQGDYEKLVKSPLSAIYSAIRYGRYLISRTSGTACSIFGIIGYQLKQHPLMNVSFNDADASLLTPLYPSNLQLAKWLSLALGLNCINTHLARTLNTQPDSILTTMKIFSVNQTEKVYRELLCFVPQNSHLYAQLDSTYRDWIASYTYEGDNGVLPQKVMADFLLGVKQMGQSFDIRRDAHLILDFIRALKAPLDFRLVDPTTESMHSHFYLMLFIISSRLNQIFTLKSDASEKSQIFFDVWNNIQFYVYPLIELRSYLFVLAELHKVIQTLSYDSTRDATQACYKILRNEAYIKCYAWLAANNKVVLEQLKHTQLPSLTWSQNILVSLNNLQAPSIHQINKRKQQQQKAAKVLENQQQALCHALCHHDENLYQRLCLQLFGYSTDKEKATHQRFRAKL